MLQKQHKEPMRLDSNGFLPLPFGSSSQSFKLTPHNDSKWKWQKWQTLNNGWHSKWHVSFFVLNIFATHQSANIVKLPWVFSVSFSYIWYKHSDICSWKLYWQYLCRSWWSSGMIPEKRTWGQFPARISKVYCKLLL